MKHPPPDGTVHPLAAYTLSFLKRLFGFEATIDTLFSDEENEVCSALLLPFVHALMRTSAAMLAQCLRILFR